MTLKNETSSRNITDVIERAINILLISDEEILRQRVENLRNLKKRLLSGRFHLAILGQFKRGKSTFLNAILGNDILPTGIVPLTAIPTFIRNGETLTVKIELQNKSEEFYPENIEELKEILSRYVTEEKNPENKIGVKEVEIFIPQSEILKSGIVLIDTPGIGSTHRHNTEATLNFLPQCDAAMFVLSPDPPITEVELEFLKKVTPKLNKFLFLLNKKDYLEEEELKEILNFLGKTLSRYFKDNLTIFPISAKEALKGKIKKDGKLIKKSKISEVEKYLIENLVAEKNKILHSAIKRKVVEIFEEILMLINLELKSLKMPIDVLEEKLKSFKEKLKEIEYQKRVIGDIFEGDRKRMHKILEERAEKLKKEAEDYLLALLKEKITIKVNEEEIEREISNSIPPYFEKKIGEETTFFKKQMREILSIHQRKANEIVTQVRKNAAEIFDIPYVSVEEEGEFKIVKEPYWISHKWKSTFSPINLSAIDKMLPVKIRKQRINKRLTSKIKELVTYNVENIRWSIYQSIDQNFRIFSRLLEEKLESTVLATKGAIEKSLEMAKNHSQNVNNRIKKIENLKSKILNLKGQI